MCVLSVMNTQTERVSDSENYLLNLNFIFAGEEEKI
jgi:hypothetical protein